MRLQLATLTGALLLASAALAQNDAPAGAPPLAQAGVQACRADAKALCPQAYAAHDRAAGQACLTKQIDKVSPACRALLEKAKAMTAKPN
jgi:hypothetical protein